MDCEKVNNTGNTCAEHTDFLAIFWIAVLGLPIGTLTQMTLHRNCVNILRRIMHALVEALSHSFQKILKMSSLSHLSLQGLTITTEPQQGLEVKFMGRWKCWPDLDIS